MEPRRARYTINYTDCTRFLFGDGRNRYIIRIFVSYDFQVSRNNRYARVPAGAAERDKLTWHSYSPAAPFFGLFSQFHYYNRKVLSLRRHSANGKVRLLRSCELIRPKLLCPFVAFHKAIFWVGGWDPYSLPRFSNLLPSHYKLLRDANNVTGADASVVSLYAAEHPFFRIVRRKLLYAGSTEDQRNAAPPHNPVRRSFAERQAGLFPSPTPRLKGCNFNSIPATNLAIHLGQGPMGPPPHNPVRRSYRRVAETLEYDYAAQNNKSRLSAAANISCLKGRPYKIWSCAPAPDGCRPHVCAASTGGRVSRPAPGVAAVSIVRREQYFRAVAPIFAPPTKPTI